MLFIFLSLILTLYVATLMEGARVILATIKKQLPEEKTPQSRVCSPTPYLLFPFVHVNYNPSTFNYTVAMGK
jgi:hypothetical protein